MDLFNQIQDKILQLSNTVKFLIKKGTNKAESEKNYRMALQQEILIQRDNKVPVTIINDICRGKPKIADLKLKRDIADVMYQTTLESIYATKLELRILENQLEREWNHAGRK